MNPKTAIITGAARGIGKASAIRLAKEGMHIAIVDLNLDLAMETAEEIVDTYGVKAIACQVDVSSESSVHAMVEEVLDRLGSVDVLVNNAGVSGPKIDICETDDEEWAFMFDVNMKGTVYTIKSVLPHFREKKAGKIINMASMAGENGSMAVSTAYGASKAAVINITKTLAKQLGPDSITVNAIAPGLIATELSADFDHRPDMVPLGRLGTPEDVAGTVAFLAGPDSDYISGMTIDVNGACYLR